MKNLIILFLFLLNNIYAQTILTGRVFSSSSKQPLYLANVVIKGTTIGTSTDENGKFTLKGEFKNTDKLLISYLGYEPKEIIIDDLLKSPDKNIFLESKLIISQTVLVKGSIAKSGITPISYTKLERSEIADAYTYQDIPEILSYTPSATFILKMEMDLDIII
ncbi:MAG: carboxypeptidase-like regulatory domain-containing protein [Melioribacteraceae bacterium]